MHDTPASPRLPLLCVSCSAALLSLAALLGSGPGCGLPPPDMLVDYPMGAPQLAMASLDPMSGVWESVPWSGGTWLPYPARAQIRVAHGLGREPREVLVYLAFDAMGTSPGLAAGDLGRVIEVTDTTVTVWNDTNGNFFARIVVY